MSPVMINILLTLGGAIIGAIFGFLLQETLSGTKFARALSFQRSQIEGEWDSSWGPLPDGPTKHHERLMIQHQRGDRIWGTAVADDQPGKRWNVEGRYDGHFLQLYYYPSSKSTDQDFLDYGCYFLKRRANGGFSGFSSGFGVDDDDPRKEAINTDYHEMRRSQKNEKRALDH